MLYKAKVSFTGLISMAMGEVRDISDSPVVKDLIKVGYIEPTEKKSLKRKKEKKNDLDK